MHMEARHSHRERILLAEDDNAMRELLMVTLRSEGYRVVPARSGLEALERLGSAVLGHGHYDAIVSDIRMPGPSGLQVLSGLRAAGEKLPIVLITAFGSNATHARAMALGASAILDKPFMLETLVSVLAEIFEQRAPRRCHACRQLAEPCSADRDGHLTWCVECREQVSASPDDRELGVGD
jgi:CheY-like chemotaxis protein